MNELTKTRKVVEILGIKYSRQKYIEESARVFRPGEISSKLYASGEIYPTEEEIFQALPSEEIQERFFRWASANYKDLDFRTTLRVLLLDFVLYMREKEVI